MGFRRLRKRLKIQGAQISRNEAYLYARLNDERCDATKKLEFLRSHPLRV